MKICPHCGESRRANHFYKHGGRPDGLSILCKDCYRAYEASPERRVKRTWNTLHTRVRLQSAYDGIEVRMTRDEFIAWAIPEYERWMKTNPSETPSLDRINPKGHYEIGNLRVIARGENARLASNHPNVHAPAGKAWCHVCKQYMDVGLFYRSQSAYNGLQKRCKTCHAAAMKRSSEHAQQHQRDLHHPR